MSRARVRVVGLGPGGAQFVTAGTTELLRHAPVARLRTRVHPAAAEFDLESYDEWYERADSFAELYEHIVDDLVRLAHAAPNHEVLYAVPGSPVVAERTVEILRARRDIEVVCEPAVSVIDLACTALGIDPMSRGLRILDALDSLEPFRGPGPLLVLQTYAPEVLVTVADRLPGDTMVHILHHLGLSDQRIVHVQARELPTFAEADHLTSLYIDGLRSPGEAMDDLVSFTRRLRSECPWDQEQTHESLTRYLLEECYEALDALTNLAETITSGEEDATAAAHVEEELGDVLFQVLFHAELGDEENRFNLASIADGVRDKLTGRHPHVFGDVTVSSADEVAQRWEVLKRAEKQRTSVLEGIPWQLPSLALHAKILSRTRELPEKTTVLNRDPVRFLEDMKFTLSRIFDRELDDAQLRGGLRDILSAVSSLAFSRGVDLELLLREEIVQLREEIREREKKASESSSHAN